MGLFFYEIIKDLVNLLYIKIEKFKNIIIMEVKRFWIARDEDGILCLYESKPYLDMDNDWSSDDNYFVIDKNQFPEVSFENSPQEVEIILPQTHNKVWHDIDEEPIYENGVTPIIIDSNYGHISQEGHYYNQVQWKSHIEFQKHREFKWAYEKDLMNL